MSYGDIDQEWGQMEKKILPNEFQQVHGFQSTYGKRLFDSIYHLTKNEQDVPFSEHILEVMHNDSLEIRCIDQHIKFEIEKHQLRVSNWQTNVVDLVLPYEK